jgi:hypothetical protein
MRTDFCLGKNQYNNNDMRFLAKDGCKSFLLSFVEAVSKV